MRRLIVCIGLIAVMRSAEAAQNWYYCEPLRAYYPFAATCPVPWREVAPKANDLGPRGKAFIPPNEVATSVTEQNDRKPGVGPSFDCSKAQTPAQQVICASPELSREDLSYAQAYYAMRQQLGQTAWQSLKLEAVVSENTALSRCGIPNAGALPPDTSVMADCLRQSYEQQRLGWVARLTGPAAEEARRPVEVHLALQRRLQATGYLSAGETVDGIYGVATRMAISTWQRVNGRPDTGFISDADATILLDIDRNAPGTVAPDREAPIVATPAPEVQAPSTPIVPSGTEDVVAQWSGGGMMTTRPFHVDGPWELQWSASSVFAAQLITVGGSSENVALQGAAGHSSSYEPVGGDFYLKIDGSGEWTMKAVRLQDAQPPGGDNARATPPAIEIPPTGTRNATPEASPPVRTSSDKPFAEMALIRASQAALSQYKTGENDMQKGAARPMRAQAICSVLTSKQVQDWVGTVHTLDTNGDGKGVLSVLIAPDIYVATWNNALSDISDRTLIDPRSHLFAVASQLRTGQKIRFSGQFFASGTDCIEERSLTLGGSITEPEYVIKFNSVSPLE